MTAGAQQFFRRICYGVACIFHQHKTGDPDFFFCGAVRARISSASKICMGWPPSVKVDVPDSTSIHIIPIPPLPLQW